MNRNRMKKILLIILLTTVSSIEYIAKAKKDRRLSTMSIVIIRQGIF